MRIKNLSGVSEVRFKKLDYFTLETWKNHLIRNFLRNGRVRVKSCYILLGNKFHNNMVNPKLVFFALINYELKIRALLNGKQPGHK